MPLPDPDNEPKRFLTLAIAAALFVFRQSVTDTEHAFNAAEQFVAEAGSLRRSENSPLQSETAEGCPYDPRTICNLMLEEAGGVPITNLALQKLLYFAHGLNLIEAKLPLVSGYFEAWQYGPVHPAAYTAFKVAGDRPISFLATRQNPLTGEIIPLSVVADQVVRSRVKRVIALYAGVTPGRLVEISQASGAPWHFIVAKARVSMAFGMRIPNDIIVERFKFHKVSIGPISPIGEPSEDAPFA